MAISPHYRGGPDIPVGDGGTGASDAATARANIGAGVGDLTIAAHSTLNHGAIPGIFNQVAHFTLTWSNDATSKTTGALGFTPAYCIAFAAFNHDTSGVASGGTAATTMSVGFATGTGTDQKSVGMFEDSGAGNQGVTTYDPNAIAGVSQNSVVGGAFKNGWDVSDVQVTTFSASEIVLDPTVAVTGTVYLLVVGSPT